jgi:hypothetical protein
MGRKRYAIIPIVVADVSILIYLTAMFLYPLLKLRNTMKTNPLPLAPTNRTIRLRKIALRTLVDISILLLVSTANTVVQIVMNGQVGWQMLNAHTVETLLAILVLQWTTSSDHKNEITCNCDTIFSLVSTRFSNGHTVSRRRIVSDHSGSQDDVEAQELKNITPLKDQNQAQGHERNGSWNSEALTATNSQESKESPSRQSRYVFNRKSSKVAFILPAGHGLQTYCPSSPTSMIFLTQPFPTTSTDFATSSPSPTSRE